MCSSSDNPSSPKIKKEEERQHRVKMKAERDEQVDNKKVKEEHTLSKKNSKRLSSQDSNDHTEVPCHKKHKS